MSSDNPTPDKTETEIAYETFSDTFEDLQNQVVNAPTQVEKFVSLRYPLDVEGPEEMHFVRFEPLTIRGATLQADAIPKRSSIASSKLRRSKSDLSSAERFGEVVGGLVGGFAEKAIEGAAINLSGKIAKKVPGLIEAAGFISGIIDSVNGSSKSTSHGSITLYSPPSMSESYSPQWTGAALGPVAGQGLQTATQGISQGPKAAITRMMNQMQNSRDGAAFATKAAGDALGTLIGAQDLGGAALKRLTSQALNPHLEALFSSVNFREFNFSFTFAPRSRKEANEVQQIIKMFKYFSAPAYDNGGNGVVFSYPDVFNIAYFNEDKVHKFHPCALTDIQITRNPFEVNSTFYDGHPVQTQMTLRFMEIAIVTKEHISQGF